MHRRNLYIIVIFGILGLVYLLNSPPEKSKITTPHLLQIKDYLQILSQTETELTEHSKNLPSKIKSNISNYAPIIQKHTIGNNPFCSFSEEELEKIYSPKFLNSSLLLTSVAECSTTHLGSLLKDKNYNRIFSIIELLNLDTPTQNLNDESTDYDEYHKIRIASAALRVLNLLEEKKAPLPDYTIDQRKKYLEHTIHYRSLELIKSKNIEQKNITSNCLFYWAIAPSIPVMTANAKYKKEIDDILDHIYLSMHKQKDSIHESLVNISYCVQASMDVENPFNKVSLDPQNSSVVINILSWNRDENGQLPQCENMKGFLSVYDSSRANFKKYPDFCQNATPHFFINFRMRNTLNKAELYM